MEIDKIESSALKVGIIISLIMALAGWVTYYFTDSEAMLLDGNFSMISVAATLIALLISKHKHKKTKTFPFGSYIYESLFVFVKGLLILGVITIAGIQNIKKILDYANGINIEPVKIDLILIYVTFIIVLCFGLYFYLRTINKKIDHKSPILNIEMQSSLTDGFLTLGIGIVFIIILFIPDGSSLAFLKDIGDATIVLIICLVFIGMPLKIIKESFIEIGGGVLQDHSSRELIEETIEQSLSPNLEKQSSYISKLGSSYFIAIFVTSKSNIIEIDSIEAFKKELLKQLGPKFQNIKVEVIIGDRKPKTS